MIKHPDQLVATDALAALASRQRAIYVAAKVLDLTVENTVLTDDAAFAMHGLDTTVAIRGDLCGEPSGMSGFVSPEKLRELQAGGHGYRSAANDHDGNFTVYDARFPAKGNSLSVDLAAVRPRTIFDTTAGAAPTTFDQAKEMSTVVGGLRVLPLPLLAFMALSTREPGKVAGVIKAQIVADEMEHPIANDRDWLRYVSRAIDMVRWGDLATNVVSPLTDEHKVRLPAWLGVLVESEFDHKALYGIR